jgi:hypothetical protein
MNLATFDGVPLPIWAKFTFCIMADLFDMTIGRLFIGVSLFSDTASALVMYLLWGPLGLAAAWETFEPTEQLDGFIPTNTLIAIAAHRKHRQRLEAHHDQ